MKIEEFVKKFSQSLIALVLSLIVLFWVLNLLHNKGGPVSGVAGKVGGLASGQSYTFS